ncbi:MAG: hypothetical protein QOK37_3703 [Thermoanaerobaculia bacterium]|jgi:hypothetical protein|nr:hypothetical protein [Thermoanaerobaculia bacterium]
MGWTANERRILAGLRTPAQIQQYLDELEYDEAGGADSPRIVMQRGKAQCYSGVLFACAALRELGHPPRLMFMDAASDDGHCAALYEIDGLWGSIAKSNFTTLRSREPIYPYIALGLSYFEGFFNVYGKRTMRAFTVPVELEPFESRGWRFSEKELTYVDQAIDDAPNAWVLPRRSIKDLSKVSEPLRTAGLLGSKAAGLWRRNG